MCKSYGLSLFDSWENAIARYKSIYFKRRKYLRMLDDDSNRWLAYQVSAVALVKFINKQVSHLKLFESNPDKKIYAVDIESGHILSGYDLREIRSLPSDYLPNDDFYFDGTDCQDFDKMAEAANLLVPSTAL